MSWSRVPNKTPRSGSSSGPTSSVRLPPPVTSPRRSSFPGCAGSSRRSDSRGSAPVETLPSVLTGLPFPALLEELAAPREVPGAGSALAAALAAAAAVVQMAARLSPGSWADAAGVAAQAEALRDRAVQLVDEDAEAYRRALGGRGGAPAGAQAGPRGWGLRAAP